MNEIEELYRQKELEMQNKLQEIEKEKHREMKEKQDEMIKKMSSGSSERIALENQQIENSR